MSYKAYTPNIDVAAFVKCYWTLDTPKEIKPEKQRIVPDGCVEMIFEYGDSYRQYRSDGSFFIQPKCFVFGQITEPLEIEATGETGIFAVRFHPEGFIPFATIPIIEMENRPVPLNELFGEEGIRLGNEVLAASTTVERIEIIERFLLERLISPESIDRVAKSSIALMFELNGQLSVDELTDQLNINRRQLERKFSTVVGLSPKQLSKIIRLQATLKMISNNQFTSLTAVAYEGNYYDQAHFIKDFKEFTGMSPKQFYANNLKMSMLFLDSE
jgi:AraC-like DNA-binding protein